MEIIIDLPFGFTYKQQYLSGRVRGYISQTNSVHYSI